MASLTYSRLYSKANVLPVATVKRSVPSSSSFNNYPGGQSILIRFNPSRFKASSPPISAIKLNDGHHHEHDHLHQKLSNQQQTLSTPEVSSSSINEKSTLSQQKKVKFNQNHPIIDLTFNNTKECYKSKRTSELMRALIVLKLCSYPLLVDNHQKLIKVGQKVLGRRLFRTLMKSTFYGHFVAGEDEKEMIPKINHLGKFGVKSIFDYSAEDELQEEIDSNSSQQFSQKSSDASKSGKQSVQDDNLKTFVVETEFADARKFRATARSYFYLGEAQCEKNMEIFLNCIDSVADITNQTGFAAIKLTALCRPQLLLKLSKSITETQHLLMKAPESNNYHVDNEYQLAFDKKQRMLMNILSWNELIPLGKVVDYFSKGNGKSSIEKTTKFQSPFTQEEEEMFNNLIRRIETIARHAYETDVRIMIDAEQTYLQPAINRITMEMMKKYNKNKSIVFNTYQCYLKSTFDTMRQDLSLSEMFDFYFGAKLVRGAYMDQERLRAKNLGYEDPVNENFEATSTMYHKTLDYLMKEIVKKDPNSKRIAIMVASHNEDTVRFAVENMKNLGIAPEHKVICFGQLYAMSDHISFSLGQSGYSVYKYVPYGPVDEVLPYLSRRAIENSSVLVKAVRERNLLRKEIIRRMISGQFFYKPIGNYTPA